MERHKETLGKSLRDCSCFFPLAIHFQNGVTDKEKGR